jgi:hypothetical protein
MSSDPIYTWDAHSDQPHVINNKAAKRVLYRRGFIGSIKTALMTLFIPVLGVRLLFSRHTRSGQTIDLLGLCVNIDTPLLEKTPVSHKDLWQLTQELATDNLQIRIPLADISNLQRYVDLVAGFEDKHILITILQDRQHIEDPSLLHRNLERIFAALHDRVSHVQIGNAVNRRKWAFVSLDEYFQFFSIAQQLRDQRYPRLKLLGSGIIDFELPNFIRSLFHGYKLCYDGAAALLYVDRRGAPENSQLFCDLSTKINLFYDTVRLSPKCANQLWITEVNWPLIGTEPFAPATGDCMVDEQWQAIYLVRYFLLAIASGKVEKCYWHQLIAPGYGLIDNRNGLLRKRPAFYSYKTLVKLFNGARVVSFRREKNGLYRLRVRNQLGVVEALWANHKMVDIPLNPASFVYRHSGERLDSGNTNTLSVSDEVVYLLDYNAGATAHDN